MTTCEPLGNEAPEPGGPPTAAGVTLAPPDQLAAAVCDVLRSARRHPVPESRLQAEVARRADSRRAATIRGILDALEARGLVLVFREGPEAELYWAANLDLLVDRIVALLATHHRRFPYEPGMRIADIKKQVSETRTLSARINVDPRPFNLALSRARHLGWVVDAAIGVRLAEFTPPSSEDTEVRRVEDAILQHLDERRFQSMSPASLASQLGLDERRVKAGLGGLVKAGRLVRIDDGRHLVPEVLESLQGRVAAELDRRPGLKLADLQALLGLGRNATVAVCEYLDRIGFTRRVGDHRELGPRVRGRPPIPPAP